jgi:hypothetical protein
MTDIGILRAMARETEARKYTAMRHAQEAQQRQYWPSGLRETEAEVALEQFLLAADEAERAQRRLRVAEEAMTNHRETA